MAFRLSPRRSRPVAPPLALHERAESDLAFVRAAMERSSLFSAVPGVGGALMGLTALGAAAVAAMQTSRERWLAVWLVEAVVAVAIGAVSIVTKARRRGVPLDVGPARRFALGLLPPLVAGAALTVGVVREGAWSLLPAVWMCSYGIGVLGAGAVSAARVVPILGAVFVAGGVAAIASPASWGDLYLAVTFGAAHLVCGVIIARRYGG